MHLTSWDALHHVNVAGRGMDVLARTIDRARSEATGACLLLDNGDSLQGTPVGAFCATQPGEAVHPWAETLNTLGFDAVGLGNHDFDYGVPFLEQVVAQTKAPTLCASFSLGRVEGVSPSAILLRHVPCSDGTTRGLRIGVTSVLPPQTARWNHRYLAGLIDFGDGVRATRRAVAALQAEGADIVVLLCHSGLGQPARQDDENFGWQIAHHVEGIDAIILGHTHERLPGPDGPRDLNGVPVVMPGYAAEVLGQIDLQLCWTADGWHVAGHDVALRTPAIDDAPLDAVTTCVAPALKRTQQMLDRTLTQTNSGFHTYFGMLMSGASDAFVARAMTDVIAEQVAGTDLAGLPLIAAVAPVAMGGPAGPGHYVDVPAGPFQARHIAMLTPFTNAIWAIVLTGAQLLDWIERSAAFFAPGDSPCARLVDPNAPSFNFDMLHGLEASIDPFGPAMFDPAGRLINRSARRVRRLTYGGELVDEEMSFLVAVTSYRGAGGGRFPGVSDRSQIVRTDCDLAEALHRTAARGALAPDLCPSVWRFACTRPARVIIETSPNAKEHLREIAAFDPQVIGTNASGFLELSVVI